MTEQELDEISARANAATPGEWIPKHIKTVYLSSGRAEHEVRSRVSGLTVAAILFDDDDTALADADVAFIAAARSDVPRLVAEVRRLRDHKNVLKMMQSQVEMLVKPERERAEKAEARVAELEAALKIVFEALQSLRKCVKEGGVPRYSVTPGAALNACVEWADNALEAVRALATKGGPK